MIQAVLPRKKAYYGVALLALSSALRAGAQVRQGATDAPATSFQLPQLVGGGGEIAIARAIQLGVKYPRQALRDMAQGQSRVTFAVAPDGRVCQIRMKYGARPDLDTAVVQAVRQLPRLQPARQHGQPVACLLSAPVTFAIDNLPRLPRHPLPALDSATVYTAVTRMPLYRGAPGFKQLSADLTAEYVRLSQGTSCFVPRYGRSVLLTIGPSGTLYNVQLVPSDESGTEALRMQFGDQVARQEPGEEEEFPEACVAQLAEAARHLPRLTPAYVDGRPVAMRLLLTLAVPR